MKLLPSVGRNLPLKTDNVKAKLLAIKGIEGLEVKSPALGDFTIF